MGGCGPFRGRFPPAQEGEAAFFGMALAPPPRAERGDVKYLVLDAIRRRPTHGYEVMQAIAQRTGGRYHPSPGTIYPTLQLLEELGLARGRAAGGRKVYEITAVGRRQLSECGAELAEIYARFGAGTDQAMQEERELLEDHVGRIVRPLGRALRLGPLGAERLDAVLGVVDEAADRIESILRGRQNGGEGR